MARRLLLRLLVEILALLILRHIIVVIREIYLNRSHLIQIRIDLCHLESACTSSLAPLDCFSCWAVHILHVEEVQVDLDIEHEDSASNKGVNVETVYEQNCIINGLQKNVTMMKKMLKNTNS